MSFDDVPHVSTLVLRVPVAVVPGVPDDPSTGPELLAVIGDPSWVEPLHHWMKWEQAPGDQVWGAVDRANAVALADGPLSGFTPAPVQFPYWAFVWASQFAFMETGVLPRSEFNDVMWAWPDGSRYGVDVRAGWVAVPGADSGPVGLDELFVRGQWVGRSGLADPGFIPDAGVREAALSDPGFWPMADSPVLEFLRLARLREQATEGGRDGSHAGKTRLKAIRAAQDALEPVAVSFYAGRVLEPLRAARTRCIDVLNP